MISSITGANEVLIVTEPTLSGVHDLERVVELSSRHFSIKTSVCVNKYDLNVEITNKIEDFCISNNIQFAGKIPYNNDVTKAMVNGKNIFEYSNGTVAETIRSIWKNIV